MSAKKFKAERSGPNLKEVFDRKFKEMAESKVSPVDLSSAAKAEPKDFDELLHQLKSSKDARVLYGLRLNVMRKFIQNDLRPIDLPLNSENIISKCQEMETLKKHFTREEFPRLFEESEQIALLLAKFDQSLVSSHN